MCFDAHLFFPSSGQYVKMPSVVCGSSVSRLGYVTKTVKFRESLLTIIDRSESFSVRYSFFFSLVYRLIREMKILFLKVILLFMLLGV